MIAQQISFVVDSLEDLQALYGRMTGAGQTVDRVITHGTAWSFCSTTTSTATGSVVLLPHPLARAAASCPSHRSEPARRRRVRRITNHDGALPRRTASMMAEDWRAKIPAKMAANA